MRSQTLCGRIIRHTAGASCKGAAAMFPTCNFPFRVMGLKKFPDMNPNSKRCVRAYQFRNFAVHHKESDAAWPRVLRACCSMESLRFHLQKLEVAGFGWPGWHFKRTADLESPRSSTGFENLAPSVSHCKHVYVALEIINFIHDMIVGARSEFCHSDLCPS
jgi:hypothetical protein